MDSINGKSGKLNAIQIGLKNLSIQIQTKTHQIVHDSLAFTKIKLKLLV